MRHESVRIMSQRSPKSLRRERQSRQRSTCCCLLVVVLSLFIVIVAFRGPLGSWISRGGRGVTADGPTAIFPLELTTKSPRYYRYALIRLEAALVDSHGNPTVAAEDPAVTITHNGKTVTTIADIDQVRLKYDPKTRQYATYWPVPWNAEPGIYIAEARMQMEKPADWTWVAEEQRREQEEEEPSGIEGKTWCVARARFEIVARERDDVKPGTCIATWEPNFRATDIRGPNGKIGDWKTMFDWAEYIGADTFWFRGAVTQVYDSEKLSMEQPFKTSNLDVIPKLAAEAHRRGLKFGVWAVAYGTYPKTNTGKPPYQYAMDISRSSGQTSEREFISLLDDRRISHLARFVADMEQIEGVDYVGFDYFRTDRGGYEVIDKLAEEMPVALPDNWESMSHNKRMLFAANRIESRGWQKYPQFYDAWNWWRAHRGAQILRAIRERSKGTKPIWIFVLSWQHGKQHGQDPLMFTDAGVTLLAPMLYQVDGRPMFDTMAKDWNTYLRPGQVNTAVGDQVDDVWHQRTRVPAAPEEFYSRIVTAHQMFSPGDEPTKGAFFHDISRVSTWGSRGPYPGTEWALAGAAAFTTVRNNWQVYPIKCTLEKVERNSAQFIARLSIENLSKKELRDIQITVLDTPNIEATGGKRRVAKTLGPGETLNVPLKGRITGASAERKNRFMVAIRITWPEGEYGDEFRLDLPRQQTVMKYIQLGG